MLNPVHLEINERVLKEQVMKRVDEFLDTHIKTDLLYWDAKEMAKRMCVSVVWLNENILTHPRMKVLERSRMRSSKRLWPYEESVEVIHHIVNGWGE